MKKITCCCLTALTFVLMFSVYASASQEKNRKTAIVLASFGTSYPTALKAITNIGDAVHEAFPGVAVEYAFTSNIIRKIWHERQDDNQFISANKNLAGDFLHVKGPLATIADLQDEGYDTIIVQPTHVYAGEEYADLVSYVQGLNAIKTLKPKFMPFDKLVIGRPALGTAGTAHDYHEDLEAAARALAGDVNAAAKKGAALVYMGHGNEFFCTGAYIEFQNVMNKMYPDTKIFIGTVEGFPSLDDVVGALTHTGVKKVVLKPMMVVAGDHATNDMASDEEDSWKSVLTKAGIDVQTHITGLGENDKWADLYVDHIHDVIRDNKIQN